MNRLAIVGAGGWGTALAAHLASHDRKVFLWARDDALVRAMHRDRQNKRHLPGVHLPPAIIVCNRLDLAAVFSDNVILAVPSHAVETIARSLQPHVTDAHSILNAAKGLEPATGQRLSHVLQTALPNIDPTRFSTLSGPNHAEEVGRGIPTATVVASTATGTSAHWQHLLTTPQFRVYTSNDQIGVELAGAVKNIIAIAAGISDGLGYGDNTKAALITRGLAEMTRLGIKLGAQPLTFAGLAGLGDLVATCNSEYSRNRAAGEAIGSGRSLSEMLASGSVIEGVAACQTVHSLAQSLSIEMPITHTVHRILFTESDPRASVAQLMNRDPKQELEHMFE